MSNEEVIGLDEMGHEKKEKPDQGKGKGKGKGKAKAKVWLLNLF